MNYPGSPKMKQMMKVQGQFFMGAVLAGCSILFIVLIIGTIIHINELVNDPTVPMIIAFFGVTIVVMFREWNKTQKDHKALTKENLVRFASILPQIDTEINAPSAIWLKKMCVYMTEHFIVSYGCGFDIIRWEDVRGVERRAHTGSSFYLLIEDQNGTQHRLFTIPDNAASKEMVKQLLETMQRKATSV